MTTPKTITTINDIRLLDRRLVAEAVGRSPDDMILRSARASFPIQAYPGAKNQWRLAVVKAWLTKRERARDRPPTLKQYQHGERSDG